MAQDLQNPGAIVANIENRTDKVVKTESVLIESKEKTFMTLMNELARSNKVKLNYILEKEEGPSHCKVFCVKLDVVGQDVNETYRGEGPSHKKAQHDAAKNALQSTTMKLGPKKLEKTKHSEFYYMPSSCKLNNIVMKHSIPFCYYDVGTSPESTVTRNKQFVNVNGRSLPSFNIIRNVGCVLQLGSMKFEGRDKNKQMARNKAASNALAALQANPALLNELSVRRDPAIHPDSKLHQHQLQHQLKLSQKKVAGVNASAGHAPPPHGDKERSCAKTSASKSSNEKSTMTTATNQNYRGEVSLVHELAMMLKLKVNFQMISESGPSHLRMYNMKCICSNDTYHIESQIASGQSKKMAKKNAAILIYEELCKIEIPHKAPEAPKKSKPQNKPAQKKCIAKVEALQTTQLNPISRLSQLRQAQHCSEPIYTLEKQTGNKRPEFTIKVSIGEQFGMGRGSNKRKAKQEAAIALLTLLGITIPASEDGNAGVQTHSPNSHAVTSSGQPNKSSLKKSSRSPAPDSTSSTTTGGSNCTTGSEGSASSTSTPSVAVQNRNGACAPTMENNVKDNAKSTKLQRSEVDIKKVTFEDDAKNQMHARNGQVNSHPQNGLNGLPACQVFLPNENQSTCSSTAPISPISTGYTSFSDSAYISSPDSTFNESSQAPSPQSLSKGANQGANGLFSANPANPQQPFNPELGSSNVNCQYTKRVDYAFESRVALELLNCGYSDSLPSRFNEGHDANNPIALASKQLEYFVRVLGFEMIQLKNKDGTFKMVIQNKHCDDCRPYISLNFPNSPLEERCNKMLIKIANLPDNFCLA